MMLFTFMPPFSPLRRYADAIRHAAYMPLRFIRCYARYVMLLIRAAMLRAAARVDVVYADVFLLLMLLLRHVMPRYADISLCDAAFFAPATLSPLFAITLRCLRMMPMLDAA